MRSPFPGMDPYLERPDRWGGVHAGLIAVMREILSRQVAPRFFVDSEDGVYVLGLDDPARALIRPDTYIVEAAHAGGPSSGRERIAAPVLLRMPEALEVRTASLAIVDTLDRQVVATLELLSPINKVQGSAGQRDFLRKRAQTFRSGTHWIEIDLLRAGTRSAGIPARGDYAAALHRAGAAEELEGWFAGLRDPLPTIAIPLQPPFEDVPLPLQEAVETLYDRYRYDTGIDYIGEPLPPALNDADAGWLRGRLAAWR